MKTNFSVLGLTLSFFFNFSAYAELEKQAFVDKLYKWTATAFPEGGDTVANSNEYLPITNLIMNQPDKETSFDVYKTGFRWARTSFPKGGETGNNQDAHDIAGHIASRSNPVAASLAYQSIFYWAMENHTRGGGSIGGFDKAHELARIISSNKHPLSAAENYKNKFSALAFADKLSEVNFPQGNSTAALCDNGYVGSKIGSYHEKLKSEFSKQMEVVPLSSAFENFIPSEAMTNELFGKPAWTFSSTDSYSTSKIKFSCNSSGPVFKREANWKIIHAGKEIFAIKLHGREATNEYCYRKLAEVYSQLAQIGDKTVRLSDISSLVNYIRDPKTHPTHLREIFIPLKSTEK